MNMNTEQEQSPHLDGRHNTCRKFGEVRATWIYWMRLSKLCRTRDLFSVLVDPHSELHKLALQYEDIWLLPHGFI